MNNYDTNAYEVNEVPARPTINRLTLRATGGLRRERLRTLRDTRPRFGEPVSPGFSTVFTANETQMADVLLHGGTHSRVEYDLMVDEIEAKLMVRQGRWTLTTTIADIDLAKTVVADLASTVQKLAEFLFRPGLQMEVTRCVLDLGSHDFGIPYSITSDVITRAQNRPSDFGSRPLVYGTVRGGLEVSFGDAPSAAASGAGNLNGNPRLRKLTLAFHRRRIQELSTQVDALKHTPGNLAEYLPNLLESMLGFAFGSKDFPDPFVRVATRDSRGMPNYMRPNSQAWEDVKASTFRSLALEEQSQGNGVDKNTNGLLSLFGIRR